ncbi:MAG: AAA family ATPase [Candidatus Aenigmatarchaeota archaeon]|nr:MAG: AAA family ATPase [Candidatus Aenigmarchaeota archaeon]
MSLIFVTGIPESGRDSIVKMVLSGSKKNLPSFEYIRFDDLVSYDVDKKSEELDLWSFSKRIEHMHKIQRDFYRNLKKKVDSLKDKENHIIVNGYFTLRTPSGYLPTLSNQSVKFFKPDVIVIIDVDLDNPEILVKFGKERVRELKYHQDINLKCAVSYSTLTRSAINVVRVEYGNLKDALKEMTDVITLALQ